MEDKRSRRRPSYNSKLRQNIINVPRVIRECSGVTVFGQRLKSFLFTTDVAIIKNCNADAIIAVYPFTPQPIITQALISAASVPIFCGAGGGLTTGQRSIDIAKDAEFGGAFGVVMNKPTPNELIERVRAEIDIPLLITIVSEKDDIEGRINAGVDFLNVSGGANTAKIVRRIREIDSDIGVIATGGKNDESILETIEAGANAISWTPPTTRELLSQIMIGYRQEMEAEE